MTARGSRVSLLLLGGDLLGATPPMLPAQPHTADWDSLQRHELPEWYQDAKLGIFIHWGLYSVPGWAVPMGTQGKLDMAEAAKGGWDVWFSNNPYAEWYLNTMKIEGSPAAQHHRQRWGKDFAYLDFAPIFNERILSWDPAVWAHLFRETGARYVVLTSKHHDGFTLWPSSVANPHLPEDRRQAARDLVGELGEAVRAEDIRYGLYYSGGLDWSFEPNPIRGLADLRSTAPQDEVYAAYADAHWRELIERYRPAILWNDISYPKAGRLAEIIADYYNLVPDGLVNNRFGAPHADFITPEYRQLDRISAAKWETCRGLGSSFGYNRMETEAHMLPAGELIRMLVDIVSKNGNLLLNVGPRADGTIPELQIARLRELGSWLAENGDAIFGTRPWKRAEGSLEGGGELRFTRRGMTVYGVLLERPQSRQIVLEDVADLPLGATGTVRLLGHEGPLDWSRRSDDLVVALPAELPGRYALALRFDPSSGNVGDDSLH